MPTFYWVPYFRGKQLNYYQYFALVGSTAVMTAAAVCYFIYLQLVHCNRLRNPGVGLDRKSKGEKYFYRAAFIFTSLVPLICSATDAINFVFGVLGMMATLSFMILTGDKPALYVQLFGRADHTVSSNNPVNEKKERKVKKKLLIAALVSVILPAFFHRTCLCFYNEEIGYYNRHLGFGINTMLTRVFQLEKACPPGPPCHLYTTLPEDSITSVFVNLHTHSDVENVTIYYDEIDVNNQSQKHKVHATTYEYKGQDWVDQRAVHSALLMNLKPSTKYRIRVFYNNHFWTNAIYKTLSDDPSVPIRMINLGDAGYTKPAIELTKIIGTLRPDVYFVGGDIAYDDNMPACAYTWDFYLKLYESLTTNIGYLMPIVLTVGNHDVGLNEMPGINLTINEYGPAYLLYFPQHYDRNTNFEIVKTIPPISRRRTFFYHNFANMHYLSLDSGYVNTFHGFQQHFLIHSLRSAGKRSKFVNYHVPMYSSCKDFDIDPQTFVYGLFHWIPHFDKYRVMTLFQNHVHAFKRSKPLKGNMPTENGTVYVGDGAFGAIPDEICKPDKTIPIFEKTNLQNNFWISIVGDKKVQHIAYNNTGHIIDEFEQSVSEYTLTKHHPSHPSYE